MKKLFILFTLVVIALTVSCERIPQPEKAPPITGKLQSIKMADTKGIPIEYGNLVAITTKGEERGSAELWFEDANRTIRVVRVILSQNRVGETVFVIPRY
ncbi:MAG: hypothetical protein GWN55_11860 [Phycisphaerae bacterium]|nr:hypothetical protein [candidate division KSB1 bacterium]NIV01995.1 hypothetical protein [Phycisphaerae bacterium]NIR73019.1 hypothetical protein [candidate division KSB1 bacterium]NIT73756.1 hypothetical protein [candidate division KSB1 bacterium]NIU27661.1 hypothetical protein [candidate division KSB1 bacterium]